MMSCRHLMMWSRESVVRCFGSVARNRLRATEIYYLYYNLQHDKFKRDEKNKKPGN